MAEFKVAICQPLINEGGYTNDPNDSGGETYQGISRNNWPEWSGWSTIDSYKPLKNGQIIQDDYTDKQVLDFYEKNFWEPLRLDEITDQDVAGKILDMAINMGQYRAIHILQQVLANDCRIAIGIDGKIGNETIKAVNSQPGSYILQRLRVRSAQFYESIVDEHPNDKQYLDDWLQRANQ